MNIIAGCSFTISKKLESLIEAGNPLYIQINSVNGNKGIGHMSMTTKRMPRPEEIGNTSIMLDVISVDESLPDFTDSAPVSNLFSGTADIAREGTESPVHRFAKVNPDSEIRGYTNRHEATPDNKVAAPPIPRPIRQAARQTIVNPAPVEAEIEPTEPYEPAEPLEDESLLPQDRQGSIMSYEELMAEIDALGNIDFTPPAVNSSNGKLSRTAAIQIEKQGKIAPRIKRPAFVHNVRGGHIEIADMEEKIANMEVFDLGTVAAKKIRDSRDLKWCLDNGLLAFCDREKYLIWLENRDSVVTRHDHGLKTGSVDEIESGMFNDSPDPMVGEYANGGSRNSGRTTQGASRRPNKEAIIRDSSPDIIDTDVEISDDDLEDVHRRKLIETMDSRDMPRESRRTVPSNYPGQTKPSPSIAGGGAKVKSIRKV